MQSTTSEEPRKVCEHCGKPLEPVTIKLPSGMRSLCADDCMTIGYKPCTCSEAVAAAERAQKVEDEREAIRRQRQRLERITAAGIKRRFIGAQHERSSEVVAACKKRRNVYICGEVGTYKTTLACASAIEMLDSGHFKSVCVATTSEVLNAIKSNFGKYSTEDPLRKYKRASVLILDDMGKESPTDWVIEQLFDLINERYGDMLPTVITTQFEPDALIKRLSKNGGEENAVAIVSRLRSKRDNALLIRLEGKDKRMHVEDVERQ